MVDNLKAVAVGFALSVIVLLGSFWLAKITGSTAAKFFDQGAAAQQKTTLPPLDHGNPPPLLSHGNPPPLLVKPHVVDQGAAALYSMARHGNVVLIDNDMGGVVGDYLAKYHRIAAAGERVVIRHDCVSACTLVLTLPHWEVCAMPGARLGFHAASDTIGGPADIPGSIWLFKHYPPAVRDWILSLPITTTVRYRSAESVGIAPCHSDGGATI